jgi:hypothetical protein
VGITNAGLIDLDQYKVYPGYTFTTGITNSGTIYDRGMNSYGGPVTNTGSYLSTGGGTGNAFPLHVNNAITGFTYTTATGVFVGTVAANTAIVGQTLELTAFTGGNTALNGLTGMVTAISPTTFTMTISTGLGALTTAAGVATNMILSSGWGSTAAMSSPSGADFPIQFTITNSGTGQGASPTIALVFPIPVPSGAPYSCTATQTGGNNAIGTFTTSALTAAGATFTYSLTPTASDTEIINVNCLVP